MCLKQKSFQILHFMQLLAKVPLPWAIIPSPQVPHEEGNSKGVFEAWVYFQMLESILYMCIYICN